jgi:hypothetical protein
VSLESWCSRLGVSISLNIRPLDWTYDIGVKDDLGDQVVGANEDIESMLEVVPEHYLHQPLFQQGMEDHTAFISS